MFKLNRNMSIRHSQLVEAAKEADANTTAAIENFNSEMLSMYRQDVLPEIEKLNAILEDLRNFCEEVESEATDSFDEQSEEWKQSGEGQAYAEWLSGWTDGTGIEDLETDEPDEIAVEEVDFYGVDNLGDNP